MRIAVVVPTTAGPRRITGITHRPALPRSQVITDTDYRPLDDVSERYDDFIGPSGPLRRAMDLPEGQFELRLDQHLESGRSWELPVALAHWVLSRGGELVAEAPDQVIWATGALDPDLAVRADTYHLNDKVKRSGALLDGWRKGGAEIVILAPPDTAGLATASETVKTARLVNVASLDEATAALTKTVIAESASAPAGIKRRGPVLGVLSAMAAVLLGAAAYAYVNEDYRFEKLFAAMTADQAGQDTKPVEPVKPSTVKPSGGSGGKTETSGSSETKTPSTDKETPAETKKEDSPVEKPVSAETADNSAETGSNGGATDAVAVDVQKPDTGKPETPAKTNTADTAKTTDGTEIPDRAKTTAETRETDPTTDLGKDKDSGEPVTEKPRVDLKLVESRAPAGSSCIHVMLGQVVAETREFAATDGRFPDSSRQNLCAIGFRLASGDSPAEIIFDPALVGAVMESDRRRNAILAPGATLTLRLIQADNAPLGHGMTAKTADTETVFRHALTTGN